MAKALFHRHPIVGRLAHILHPVPRGDFFRAYHTRAEFILHRRFEEPEGTQHEPTQHLRGIYPIHHPAQAGDLVITTMLSVVHKCMDATLSEGQTSTATELLLGKHPDLLLITGASARRAIRPRNPLPQVRHATGLLFLSAPVDHWPLRATQAIAASMPRSIRRFRGRHRDRRNPRAGALANRSFVRYVWRGALWRRGFLRRHRARHGQGQARPLLVSYRRGAGHRSWVTEGPGWLWESCRRFSSTTRPSTRKWFLCRRSDPFGWAVEPSGRRLSPIVEHARSRTVKAAKAFPPRKCLKVRTTQAYGCAILPASRREILSYANTRIV